MGYFFAWVLILKSHDCSLMLQRECTDAIEKKLYTVLLYTNLAAGQHTVREELSFSFFNNMSQSGSKRSKVACITCLALGYLIRSGCTASPVHVIERAPDRSVPEELQAVVSWLRPFASIVCHLPALAFMLLPSCWDFVGMLCRRGPSVCVAFVLVTCGSWIQLHRREKQGWIPFNEAWGQFQSMQVVQWLRQFGGNRSSAAKIVINIS